MKRAIVQVGYTQYVMDTEKAITLLGLLEQAEIYETKWVDKGANTHHIYEQDNTAMKNMQLLPETLYRLAKLAGKPE